MYEGGKFRAVGEVATVFLIGVMLGKSVGCAILGGYRKLILVGFSGGFWSDKRYRIRVNLDLGG